MSLGMLVSSKIRCSGMYITGLASSGASPCQVARYFTMDRASEALMVRPFSRTIRLMASSQPSGVERSHEILDRLPFSSFV